MRALLNPTFWFGVALILLGVGNWVIGESKVQAHRRLLRSAEMQVVLTPTDGFDQLNVRTNASLLKPFRVSAGRVSALEQKLDFYRVVKSGGRVFCLIGILFVLVGCLRASRHTRLLRRTGTIPVRHSEGSLAARPILGPRGQSHPD